MKILEMASSLNTRFWNLVIKFFVWGGDEDYRRKMKDLGF